MTVIILAGGKSSRMGRDKLLLPFEGEGLLERAVRRYSAHFSSVFVSVADPAKYPAFSDMLLPDLHPGRGPLSGLEAGLLRADGPVFLTAADMPFSSPEAALKLHGFLSDEAELCVLTDAEGRPEPLFGWYRPSLLPRLQARMAEGRNSLQPLFSAVPHRFVSLSELGCGDGSLLLNVNDPEEYERLLQRSGTGAGSD